MPKGDVKMISNRRGEALKRGYAKFELALFGI
jgi:hypothetical protein